MKTGKVMMIGPIGSGKSTLTKCLLEDSSPVLKTQALSYNEWIIDTPGEYSENPLFYRSLLATSLEARAVLVVQDATRLQQILPPNFAQGFPIVPLGVITKIDHPDANLAKAEKILRQVLPQNEIFHVSSVTLKGISELRTAIEKYL
ncbi:EutP/PduV family microcompartment system protein [Neobacillus sp. NPDC058068]|uniref:EutP/PduV family microcompartment system protein n=1 Tax=Neobacillus sp. NPDC058068 TaxID=3346325 RepID=UPI0036DB5F4E